RSALRPLGGVDATEFMAGRVRYFGLTGGIASGKSSVARKFAELGAKIIDADRLGHDLIRSGLPAYDEILHRFGREILDASGEIDRKRLGAIAFADPQKLRELNAILHPRIIKGVERLAVEFHARDPHAVILVDAALIFEAGIGGRFAKVIVAWCRPEQQIERLMINNGLSREDAERRIGNQMPAEEKRRRADYVIDCSGSLDETRRQVEALYQKLKRLAEGQS
ncbi:MAG: dephospho-CoA kinase, partial [Acidobacteria bacterium]|nr:dephospho-CoA kinase [Acidobacteriota bacterium]